jgi:hypothetical protein
MSTGKTMTIRIDQKTRVGLNLWIARVIERTGQSPTIDEAIAAALNEIDPEIMKQAQILMQNSADNNKEES